jgi:hypothetical protein
MEPSVVLVLIAAALAAFFARDRQAAPEPAPVRVDDDSSSAALNSLE